MKAVIFALTLGLTTSLASTLQAAPLSPESIKNLKASGRLKDVASREIRAHARGVDAPGKNIMKALRARRQGVPRRDQTTLHVPVILVDFDDNQANADNYPPEHYEQILFSQGELDPGSVREWYDQNSYGEVDVVGEVVGWVRAPKTYEYYVNGQYGEGDYPQNAQKLVRDAAQGANGDIDFSNYDNDGDGYVDNLIVVHAGSGAEANGGDSTMIWSHSWDLDGHTIQLDGVIINQYTIQPIDGKVGVFAHELGHGLFGLPDLYDRDYSSNGLGNWTMMAGGMWGGNGDSPTHFDAWCKWQTGFSIPTVIDQNQANASIAPAEGEAASYLLWTNGQYDNEYFLIENRQQTGFDASLPGAGLLIYHVDDNVADQNDDEWYPGHVDNGHYQVALEQADGNWDMEQGVNRGDDGDEWPGSSGNQNLDAESTPNSRDYGDNETLVSVLNIAADGDNMTCDLEVSAGGGGIEGGEISYDDDTPVYYDPEENYWSRVTFTAPSDLVLTGVKFMPYNITPNLDDPCWIKVYSEDGDHNLGDLLWEYELDQVPETNLDNWDANWITVDIPQEEQLQFQSGDNFSIVYGSARGGDAGWWCLFDEGTNVFRSYTYVGDEPSANHADWGGWDYDILLRAEVTAAQGNVADIALDAAELDFGEVSIGESAEQWLAVSNAGGADLTVSSLTIDPADGFSGGWQGHEVLAPGDQLWFSILFMPTETDLYAATLSVESDDPDEGIVSVSLVGIGVNDAPVVVNPIGDITVAEDAGRRNIAHLDSVFSDPNNDNLDYTVSGPDALNLSISGHDLLYMEPDGDYNGSNLEATVTADDGRGGRRLLKLAVARRQQALLRRVEKPLRELRSVTPTAEGQSRTPRRDLGTDDVFLVTITSVNDAPIFVDDQGNPLGAEPNFNVNEDEELSFTLRSHDVDNPGNDLRMTLRNRGGLPNGYRYTDNHDGTGSFVWRPNYDAGKDAPYMPLLRVTDPGGAYDELILNITVVNVNRAPTWTDVADSVTVDEAQVLRFNVTGSDPDADTLTITMDHGNLPEGYLFTDHGDGTGTFSWTPTYDDGGEYNVIFTLSDGDSSAVSFVHISVRDVNGISGIIRGVPDHYYLSANYPNPFNARTTVKYGLPAAGRASLEVWSVAGRRVAALIDNRQAAGNYEFVWDAQALPAGMYLLRMQVADFTTVRKVTLMK